MSAGVFIWPERGRSSVPSRHGLLAGVPSKSRRVVVQNFSILGLAVLVFLVPEVLSRAESAPCHPVTYEQSEYTVCEVDLRRQSLRLFWKKPDGHPYEYLSSLPRAIGNHSRHLLFATNGGMYHPDNSPVGLYVEEGRELVRANTNAGPGNFHLRPNGVFYLTGEVAAILETHSFIKQKPQGQLRRSTMARTGPEKAG
jgi:uncharacterized protein YigE (DUF2233 family)